MLASVLKSKKAIAVNIQIYFNINEARGLVYV